MNKIYVDLENCYGIPKLDHTFEFSENKKAYIIYAPNGTMKTSFSNVINDIQNNVQSMDRLYPNRNSKRIVKEINRDLKSEDVFVIDTYVEGYQSEQMSTLLANDRLKKEYDAIYKKIENNTESLIKSLKILSGLSKNCDELFVEDFGYTKRTIYECLQNININYLPSYKDKFKDIKYGKLFNKESDKLFSDKEIIQLLEQYISQYEQLLENSPVFKNEFNHNNANDVLKTLDKSGFFKAKHKVYLNNMNAMDSAEFEQTIEIEKNKILTSQELSDSFNKIDDLLAANINSRLLRKILENNRYIIPELRDIKMLKRKIWIYYINQNIDLFNEVLYSYQNAKIQINNIINKAKEDRTIWNTVISQYNDRFSNMPFKLYIKNKEDVILKNEVPTISFLYQDRGEEMEVEEEKLLLCLSNGEKKALYLLNIIFEIEARKKKGKDVMLVVDDIADSFDYRNKYAIIEYLKDIINSQIFKMILLTHNFDFYRTVAGRLNLKRTSYFALKTNNEIKLEKGQYFENVLKSWKNQIYMDNKIFISSISFIRNLVEYQTGSQGSTYNNLTSLLHYKPIENGEIKATTQILVSDLINCYIENWNAQDKFRQNQNQIVLDLIFETADKLLSESNPDLIIIQNKIVLSIAIRIRAEQYLITRINNPIETHNISGNQTSVLRGLVQFDSGNVQDRELEEIIEKVLIMTSENIHINSFMYEPIIDMSLEELINLYKEIKERCIPYCNIDAIETLKDLEEVSATISDI